MHAADSFNTPFKQLLSLPNIVSYSCSATLCCHVRQAGTGTWHGPAPRGAANPEAALAAADKAAAAVREPTTVMLCTGQRMPLIGLGTYKLQSADAVTMALELGYRHFDCECSRSTQCSLQDNFWQQLHLMAANHTLYASSQAVAVAVAVAETEHNQHAACTASKRTSVGLQHSCSRRCG
jgi:hypothetical protein